MLAFDDALKEVLRDVTAVASERVGLFEAAGRTLREDVHAGFDLPPFDYSAMDGYAIATSDLGAPPHRLVVAGESSAGPEPEGGRTLTQGTAMRIFTGAVLPRGADAVIMQEDTTREGDAIVFARAPTQGANVRRRGEDLREGTRALTSGSLLHAGRIALAATLGRASLAVSRRPLVTVLATGDELRSPGDARAPGTIVESNGFFVKAEAERLGAVARLAPFVPDAVDALDRAIEDALASTDLLVTIGGVSVGDHDLVRPALERAGVALGFYKVAMKPGKPITFGRRGATRVLGLPGNPASASLTFVLFGVPLLRALLGRADQVPTQRQAEVRVPGGALERKPGRTEFVRAVWDAPSASGRRVATLLSNQASGAVTSFASATCLVRVEADRVSVRDGDVLPALDLYEGT